MNVAPALRAFSGREVHAGIEREQRRHSVQHGDVDASADAALLALHERGKHGLRHIEAGHQIGDRSANLCGRTVGIPGDVHHAGLALQDQVVARTVRVRTGSPEA